MAGLVAAARLRELGHEPRVLEKGTRAGGSMLLSSCVVWRHLEWESFRAECPDGDERLQRLIWERLDDGLGWLESLGAEPVWRDTENPLTTGRRYDPRALTRLLVESGRRRRARDAVARATPSRRSSSQPAASRGDSRASAGLLLRANPWSEGDGLDFAVARGAGYDRRHGRVLRPRHAGSAGAHATRRTSSRSRSSTAARRASSPTTGARSRRRRSRGTRTTSRSSSAPVPGMSSARRTSGSRPRAPPAARSTQREEGSPSTSRPP